MNGDDVGAQVNSDDIGLLYIWWIVWWVLSIVENYWPSYQQSSIPCTIPMNMGGKEEEGGEASTFTGHLKEINQHNESEVTQKEGSLPSFQGGLGQDEEMQSRKEGTSKPQLEEPEMETSVAIEGDAPPNEAKIFAPEFTSVVTKMPERQILPDVPEFEELTPHPPPPVQKAEDSFSHLHTQFRRLHGCIQPAASRLQDSSKNKERATKRVVILVRLIKRDPSFPLGNSVNKPKI